MDEDLGENGRLPATSLCRDGRFLMTAIGRKLPLGRLYLSQGRDRLVHVDCPARAPRIHLGLLSQPHRAGAQNDGAAFALAHCEQFV
jgi:hypothetical protein